MKSKILFFYSEKAFVCLFDLQIIRPSLTLGVCTCIYIFVNVFMDPIVYTINNKLDIHARKPLDSRIIVEISVRKLIDELGQFHQRCTTYFRRK